MRMAEMMTSSIIRHTLQPTSPTFPQATVVIRSTCETRRRFMTFFAAISMLSFETGEVDLVAEFVDLFRQYGCTERNDLQVRDGARYLLRLFHAAGGRWMAHREPYEEKDISEYDLIHKPWTGMSGLRPRIPESPEPGTYGAVVRSWLR